MREFVERIDKSEAVKYLKLMLKIDDLCDHEEEMGEFLPKLLHQIAQYLDVSSAAIMLLEEGDNISLRGRYDRGRAIITDENLIQIAREAIKKDDWIIENKSKRPQINNAIATPVRKLDRILGAFVLANKSTGAFTDNDQISVSVVEARVDQVLDKYLLEKKDRRIRLENELMKEIDRIRDASSDHGQALDMMVAKTLNAVDAQIGFITLYDTENDRHVPGGRMMRGSRPLSQEDYKIVGDRVRQARELREPVIEGKIKNSEIDSLICVPMYMAGIFLGCVVLINKTGAGQFTYDDLMLAKTTAEMIDSYIFEEEKYKRLVMLVGQDATRDVEEALMGRRADTGRGERKVATMLFADIRNYSTTTKDMDPDIVVRMLNDFFNAVTPIITNHNGLVDKYVGDEIVALFRRIGERGEKMEHPMDAVEAALAMQEELERINREWELTGRPRVNIGIGIHTGEVIIGQIGSYDRRDYTAIGSNMNYAARLQSIAKAGQVIISEATYLGTHGRIAARRVGPFSIKGFGEVMAYQVEGHSPEHF